MIFKSNKTKQNENKYITKKKNFNQWAFPLIDNVKNYQETNKK